MSWRPPASRYAPQHPTGTARRPVVISLPKTRNSLCSWDVEGLGSPPRKYLLNKELPPTPEQDHVSPRSPPLDSPLSRSSSKKSCRSPLSSPPTTPDLYHGQSEESESSPTTPKSGRSPTPVSAQPLSPEQDPRPKAPRWTEDPEIVKEREQFEAHQDIIYHHKFSDEEVPYMQSYSDVSLANDFHTFDLLCRLQPENSPTFYDYGPNPPTDVLDVGCGRGHWAADAAGLWPTSRITAFDLVDLGRPIRQSLDEETAARITWVQGNFITDPLPFEPNTFNLVRICNLTLAIPKDHWQRLLQDARRVLKPGGRLELIDDQVFFPTIRPPRTPPLRSGSLRMRPTPSFDSDEDSDEDDPFRRSPSAASRAYMKRTLRVDPTAEFKEKTELAKNMEKVFQDMLVKKYNIDVLPQRTIIDTMESVFGLGRSNTIFKARLIVPITEDVLIDEDGNSRYSPRTPTSAGSGRRSLDDDNRRNGPVAPKAMRVLGEVGASSPRPSTKFQAPGFILVPDLLVPCEPEVLEMYACKNIHTLLSCKRALASYVQERTDAEGKPLISEEEFDELMWSYDEFKRARFHWPDSYAGFDLHDEAPPTSATKQLFSRRRAPSSAALTEPYTLAQTPMASQAVPIRAFRVYQGIKAGPGADAVELIPLPIRSDDRTD